MNRMGIHNKNLIKSEIENYLTHSGEIRFIQRLQILYYLIEHENLSHIAVGEFFNTSPRAIFNWIKKINETGDLESIRDRPGKGRKTQLTHKQVMQVKNALNGKPDKVGVKADKWNGKTLAEFISLKLGITLQDRQCQRLMLKLGFSNKRGRPAKIPV